MTEPAPVNVEQEMAGWYVERGVTCVVAPCCGFTFDASHTDVATGAYSCPCCEPARTVAYDRQVLVDVLVYHYRVAPGKGCGCGWNELGRMWPEHVADVYEQSVEARS